MSADYDLVSNIRMPVGTVLATLDADANGPAVDTQLYKSVTLGWYVGIGGITFTSTNRLDIVIQESDDNSAWNEVVADDLILPYGLTYGTAGSGIVKSYTAAKAAADTVYNLVGYRGKKRYCRLRLEFGGTHSSGTPIEIITLQGHPMHKPVWQSSIET